jgi:TolB protein
VIAFLAALLLLLGPTMAPAEEKVGDETLLGELLITGSEEDQRPWLALLPSLSPDLEDVIVRGVVRRDLELSGLFRIVDERKAPPGLYGFEDPIDVPAWKKTGAQVIVKTAARKRQDGKIEVRGVAYLLAAGEQPVYEKTITVVKEDVRVTAHRVTDALLGALTGREGGFASRLAFSSKWGKNPIIFTVDSDGHSITRQTDPARTSIYPAWGPDGYLFYSESKDYAPFTMMRLGEDRPLALSFQRSILAVAFSQDGKQLALSAAEGDGTAIYLGKADGSGMKKVSKTAIAVDPVFSPSGKLAWVGGQGEQGGQRIYIDGKAVSPTGFTASSPTFCDTEDGIFLVFAVNIGGGRQDLVWTGENGGKVARLTQNQGSNSYPACSPDGRMLAFFSTRKSDPGLYVKSLKSFATFKISGQLGQSLKWARLPPPEKPQPTGTVSPPSGTTSSTKPAGTAN